MNYVIGGTGNSWYYYHYNAHGDVIAVTDSNGNVYRQYVYDPYGNIISVKDGSGNSINLSSDSFNNAYLYAGYRYDSETGLYYLNARYYAPGIGRFLTKERVLGDDGNPKTLNRYAYVQDDPINMVDPYNHLSKDQIPYETNLFRFLDEFWGELAIKKAIFVLGYNLGDYNFLEHFQATSLDEMFNYLVSSYFKTLGEMHSVIVLDKEK